MGVNLSFFSGLQSWGMSGVLPMKCHYLIGSVYKLASSHCTPFFIPAWSQRDEMEQKQQSAWSKPGYILTLFNLGWNKSIKSFKFPILHLTVGISEDGEDVCHCLNHSFPFKLSSRVMLVTMVACGNWDPPWCSVPRRGAGGRLSLTIHAPARAE